MALEPDTVADPPGPAASSPPPPSSPIPPPSQSAAWTPPEAPPTDAESARNHDRLQRKMSSRHLTMISFGGVIGTGLFVSSGYTISQAGPLGTVIAYAVGALLVYLVMLCLGELSVAMPWTGAFHVYAKELIGPGTGFVVAVLYWLTWTIALGSEFTAAGAIMRHWFPATPVWMWSAIFIVVVFATNVFSVRVFAEAESWLAGVKVFAIIAFIVLGGLAIIGIIPMSDGSSSPGRATSSATAPSPTASGRC
ncbi:amino acid permease [Actinomyces sp. 432]|uniref:amino acid permease n=1 Tax=Actinomyces sp. 432 TaxID=2057798 RepID=UPI0023513018|nr:amino acid permease [Actinomyces sp. 432]